MGVLLGVWALLDLRRWMVCHYDLDLAGHIDELRVLPVQREVELDGELSPGKARRHGTPAPEGGTMEWGSGDSGFYIQGLMMIEYMKYCLPPHSHRELFASTAVRYHETYLQYSGSSK